MFEANPTRPCIPCYLITDSAGMWSYGLGMARMRTRNPAPFLADGYLTSAETVEALASKLGVDAGNLASTVDAMNAYARTGGDPEFGRGTTAYHRVNGDASHRPNPTLGPRSRSRRSMR